MAFYAYDESSHLRLFALLLRSPSWLSAARGLDCSFRFSANHLTDISDGHEYQRVLQLNADKTLSWSAHDPAPT
jgi:hypothetical protein